MFNTFNSQGNANRNYSDILAYIYQNELRSTIQVITHSIKDVEQEEHFYIADGNANLYNNFGNQYMFFIKLIIDLLQDPATLLLVIYPKGTLSYHKETYTTLFITILSIMDRNWKQLRCPSIKDWITKI